MKRIYIILLACFLFSSQSQATVCYGISSDGATTITVSVTAESAYTATPQFFWTTGNVTVAWPEDLGAGAILTAASGSLPFLADGPATLDNGTYYQKYGFAQQSNVMIASGASIDVLTLTISQPAVTSTFEISEIPPATVNNGNAALANVLSEQFASGACNLMTDLGLLPVELTTFNVTKKGDEDAMVTWSTSSEHNTSHFEVERSLDEGKNWEKVGIVSAVGNSTNLNNYTFDDNNLKRFIDRNQLIYYRLKSVDFDQTHQFSKTKNIEVLLDLISIAVYPNPTVEGVQVTVHSKDKAEELTAVVKDIHGRTMLSQNLGRDKMINQYVNFSELAAGTYFLSVQSLGRVFATERLVVLNK